MANGPVVASLSRIGKVLGTGRGAFELYLPALRIAPGARLALVGTSGSGKSTLLDILALAMRPDKADEFHLADHNGTMHDIAALWRKSADDDLSRLRALSLGYVLQTGGLLPYLKVRDNILLPLRLANLPTNGALDKLAEALDIVEQLDKTPSQLSVGQRQRAAIARALVHRPVLLIADEPTASVHPSMARTIMNLIVDQAQRQGAATIVATHDQALAESMGFEIVPLRSEQHDDGHQVSVFGRQTA
jgi:ABC-type lipoprotein export system ATPase subunit